MPEPFGPFTEADTTDDPLDLYRRWFDEASRMVDEPEAVVLGTATADGHPSLRLVLLKEFGPEGFVFFTNYEGRKGRELAAKPHAALLSYWEPLGRQVRIEGDVHRLDAPRSDAYFASRSRASQIGAHASQQSAVLADRAALDAAVASVGARFEGRPVPRPEYWGGFRLVPAAFEFWQRRADRLHDRFAYRGGPSGWRIERLAP